ncbi:hypothetical protein [Natronosalvus halobius]|uniref:hypothetical protein n=1 Tax=Natronosalvus halobius TaxID=2953746 RepID=UPI0020A072E6|nr:hypothetical protein [Natronosalvus halobius]USZ72462.1 hypothetical protein NGM15_03875 [Natronosalvus halobius]
MSSNSEEEVPGREVAYRVFAGEFDDADYSHAESDEERAPNYVITPTGARLNRVFVVGALTEVTAVNDEMLRARVVDPTGAFVVYAGQYQPDELAFLERIDPPAFVAVTGKARTFQPDDSDVVYTSIRPESIATVDPETRERWVVSAAEQTLERVGTYAAAADLEASGAALETALHEAGVERGLAAGIPLAQDHYGTTPAYLESVRDLALDAAAVVAGDRDEVRGLDRRPSDSQPDASSFTALASAESVDLDLNIDLDLDVDGDGDGDLQDAPVQEGSESEAPATAESGAESADLEVDDTSGDDDASGDDQLGDFDAGESDSTADELGDFDADADAEDEDEEATAEESGSMVDEESVGEEPLDEESVDVGQNGDIEEDELEDASGMYEMDDEEREQIEAEFGTEFSTGADVDEPGEADIDVPAGDESVGGAEDDDVEPKADEDESVEEAGEADEDEGVDEGDEKESAGETEDDEQADADQADEGDDGEEETDIENVDLQDLVVETMTELDDGDGADRSAVIDTVTDETGADEDDVEEAIDDALMGGQCYEPGDGKLKAI